MKKATKRLTMVVAILLSLVLLTSSVVSTTLAKFVIAKSSTTEVTLNKYGIEVVLQGSGSTVKKGDSIIYTDKVTLLPDDTEKKITASIKGMPTVASTIVIDVDVDYADNDFTIPADVFDDIKEPMIYFPLGFKIGGTSVVNPYNQNKDTELSSAIEAGIKNKIGSKLSFSTSVTDKLQATWATNKDISSAIDISLSYYWPEDYTTQNAISNEIGTYLTNNHTHTCTITYKISVTQN